MDVGFTGTQDGADFSLRGSHCLNIVILLNAKDKALRSISLWFISTSAQLFTATGGVAQDEDTTSLGRFWGVPWRGTPKEPVQMLTDHS